MNYNFDINKFILRNLPVRWRLPRFIAWMYCLLKPVEQIHSEFLAFIDTIRNQMSYNGQTISLEDLLNTTYPAAAGGIYIVNGITLYPPVYIHKSTESDVPVYIYKASEGGDPTYIFKSSEIAASLYDFTIMVPSSLIFNADQMTALVKKYKLSGKRFNIQTY